MMNKLKGLFSVYILIGLMIAGVAIPASGQLYRNQREIRDITRQLKNQVDNFQYGLSNQLRRSRIAKQDAENLEDGVRDVKDKIRDFETKFERQRETADDVTAILEAAREVNDYLEYNSVSSKVDSDWVKIRGDLDRLAGNYNIYWNWSDRNTGSSSTNDPTNYPTTGSQDYSYALTGTYQLDKSRSEDAKDIAERAIGRNGSRDNNSARQDLEDKLEAPEQIALDVRGQQVTLATSNAEPINLVANGRDMVESTSDGRTIRVRTTLSGQELTVSSTGGDSDFTITFSATESGRSMRVTRRITTSYLRQTVFAESVYNKTDSIARLGNYDAGGHSDNGGYSTNDPNDSTSPPNYPTTSAPGNYTVPAGTILTGTLDNEIDTKVSQNNDEFRLTVQSPNAYRGAVIDGYVSGIDRSGRVSGRSEITFNFRTIRLANGQTYDFAGILKSVTDENGKTIKVDQEGAAKGDSQTKETITRSGIGAAVGALIGAIAGGGKGAAIGAVIGGGAGAGSVILQGKDDLKLKAGSEVSVESSSPLR